MSKEFKDSFQAFLDHIGPKPDASLTLDRIDNDRGYERGNVRWANWSTQSSNRRYAKRSPKRNAVTLTYEGETLRIPEWAEKTGLAAWTINDRLRRGLPIERVLATKR
jgi:hypothetical protein